MSELVKLIIVEDHEIFRTGIARTINKNMKDVSIVGIASNGAEFLALLENTPVDVVLMDIRMPIMNGFDATLAAMKLQQNIKIGVLSAFYEDETIQQMLEIGAKGFFVKNISSDELEKGIKLLAEGKNYFSSEIWSFFTSKFNNKQEIRKSKFKLTRRQSEILQLICDGLENEAIASKLFISERTVIGHKSNLLEKMDCKSTASLIAFSIKNAYVSIN